MARVAACLLILLVTCEVAAQNDEPGLPSGTLPSFDTSSSTDSLSQNPSTTASTDSLSQNPSTTASTDSLSQNPSTTASTLQTGTSGSGRSNRNESSTSTVSHETNGNAEVAGSVTDDPKGAGQAEDVNRESGNTGSKTTSLTSGTFGTEERTSTGQPKSDVSMSSRRTTQETSSKDASTSSSIGKTPPGTDLETGTTEGMEATTTESPETRADRELLYITIAICSGAVVLVFSVAVITYFTHRELPARVDIRKYASYSSV